MDQDRLFVRDGRRHYRRRYSLGEVRAGAAVLLVLGAILAWVVWRGAHPDPALFAGLPLADRAGASGAAGWGPFPQGLAPAGWRETGVQSFGPDDLYVKIDGRADYYLALGFRRLHVLSLEDAGGSGRTIDLELFDMGKGANAISAYEGERAPATSPEVGKAGLRHLDRNALFLTWGRHYLRAIASDESPEARAVLEGLAAPLEAALEPEPLPWTYALFVGRLGFPAARVSYQAENAFSFGFARDVHLAALPGGDSELFVVAGADEARARALGRRFAEGFRSLGDPAGESDGIAWTRDRYLSTISGAGTEGWWVVGVRGAADREAARQAVAGLRKALRELPPELVARVRGDGGGQGQGGAGKAGDDPAPAPREEGYR